MNARIRRQFVAGLVALWAAAGPSSGALAQEGVVLGLVPQGVVVDLRDLPGTKVGARFGFREAAGEPKEGVQGQVLEVAEGQALLAVSSPGAVQAGDRAFACQTSESSEADQNLRAALGRLRAAGGGRPSGDVESLAGEIDSVLAARGVALQQGACSVAAYDAELASLSARLQEALGGTPAGASSGPAQGPPAVATATGADTSPQGFRRPSKPALTPATQEETSTASPESAETSSESTASPGGGGDALSRIVDVLAKAIEQGLSRFGAGGVSGAAATQPSGDSASGPTGGDPSGSSSVTAPSSPIGGAPPPSTAPSSAPSPGVIGDQSSPPQPTAGTVPSSPRSGVPSPASGAPPSPTVGSPGLSGPGTSLSPPLTGAPPPSVRPPAVGLPAGGPGSDSPPSPTRPPTGPGTTPPPSGVGTLPPAPHSTILPLRPLPGLAGHPPETVPPPAQSGPATPGDSQPAKPPWLLPLKPPAGGIARTPQLPVESQPSGEAATPGVEPPPLQGATPPPPGRPGGAFQARTLPDDARLFGHITGRVLDEKGRPLRGALVVAGSATVRTNEQGNFTFQNLKPGSYRITVSMRGYLPEAHMVILASGRSATVTLTLRDGKGTPSR
jgi:hypothetical protein